MKLSLFIATLLWVAGSAIAENTKFSVKATGAKQLVQFISNAPLEKIVGKAGDIRGELSVDLENLAKGASGAVRVDLRTLDTGLSLRNQHMRENHLQTGQYPEAVFTIVSIVSAEPPDISGGGIANTLLRGKLELHGVTKEYEMLGQIEYDAASQTLFTAYKWNVMLHDHAIDRPEFLFMKLSEKQQITVELEFGR